MNVPNRGFCRLREEDLGIRARYYLRRNRIDMYRRGIAPGDNPEPHLAAPLHEAPQDEHHVDVQEEHLQNVRGNDDAEVEQDVPLNEGNIQDNGGGDPANLQHDPQDNHPAEDQDNIDGVQDHGEVQEEAEDSEDERDEHLNLRWEDGLYQGAAVTVGEALTIALGLMLRHNLSLTCVDDILASFRLVCPNEGFKQTSTYHLKKYFSLGNEENFSKHYFCSLCQAPLAEPNAQCHICNVESTSKYFVVLPFLRQLRQIVKRNGFMELLQHRFNRGDRGANVLSDIYDGTVYRSQVDEGFLANPHNISLMWYADGVPVFKSSKISMWPIYLSINELPYQKRTAQENIMLAALWFGKNKIDANLVLGKLRPQFEELYTGKAFRLHNGNIIRIRGILLAGTCDVPAKTSFLNLTLYSGAFGCCNCKLQGHTFWHNNLRERHSQIYPYQRNIRLRTSLETAEVGRMVVLNNIEEGIEGVKGISVLHHLMPDYIGGMGIDAMHKVYGGCVKKLVYLWFHSSYSGQPFSLRLVMDNIDRRLTSIKPPKYVHRMPRTVEELCHWKCSELKNWFYYFSIIVLSGIMLPRYFNHYLLLVLAISLLNTEEVSQTDLQKARNLLHKFVRKMPELYGERQSTINVHGLLHLPECVLRLGPLFVYSCFPFEDLNGKLLKHVHGTSNLDSQIVVRHTQSVNLAGRLQDLDDGQVRDFVSGWKKKQVKINERIFQGCYSVGHSTVLQNIAEQIRMCLQNLHQGGTISVYSRLLKDKLLYVCENYEVGMKTKSSCVLFKSNGRKLVGSVTQFLKISNCECVNVCRCEGDHFAIVNELETATCFYALDDNDRFHPIAHLKSFQRRNVHRAVPITDLVTVCHCLIVDNQQYIGFPLNSQEKE